MELTLVYVGNSVIVIDWHHVHAFFISPHHPYVIHAQWMEARVGIEPASTALQAAA